MLRPRPVTCRRQVVEEVVEGESRKPETESETVTDNLVINPNFWLEPTRMGGEVVRVTILAPVRGRGLQYFFTDRKEHPEIFRLVTDIDQARRQARAPDPGVIPEGSRETLYQMGVLVRPDEVSQSVRFHCFLDESILDWIPERCRQALDFDANPSDFIVNPTYAYQPGDKPPEVLAHRIQIYRQFLTGHPLVWIENPGTHLLTAYWVSQRDQEALSLLRPGEKLSSTLDLRLRKILEMARILVPEDYSEQCRQEWEKLLSRIVGRPLQPSHDYLFSYEGGAILDKHFDYDQDEFGVSLLLDYEPEPVGASPWPLFLESPKEGEIKVSQEIGNAVFYNGCELPHYRHSLPAGHRSASLVFHYVRQDFKG